MELLMQYNLWIATLCTTQGIDVNYQILMTNDDSNIMFRQFSADEFCKPVLIFNQFCCLFIAHYLSTNCFI